MNRYFLISALALALMVPAGVAHADDHVKATRYTGYFYKINPDLDKRACVVHRESRDNPKATNGSHHGLYQFSVPLSEGAAWMMQADPIEPITSRVRKWLQSKPAKEWPRYWQDRAFYTVYNWTGPGSGAKHWHLDSSPCNGMVR